MSRAPRFRIRLDEDDSPELYCHGCHEWWPITIECWPSRTSFWRCRACENERKRLYSIRRLLDPEGRIKNINKSRRYRAYLKNEEPELLDAADAQLREAEAMAARRLREEQKQTTTRERNREYMRAYRARKARAAKAA